MACYSCEFTSAFQVREPSAVPGTQTAINNKTDVNERTEAFNHVGLPFNEPPGITELPFI